MVYRYKMQSYSRHVLSLFSSLNVQSIGFHAIYVIVPLIYGLCQSVWPFPRHPSNFFNSDCHMIKISYGALSTIRKNTAGEIRIITHLFKTYTQISTWPTTDGSYYGAFIIPRSCLWHSNDKVECGTGLTIANNVSPWRITKALQWRTKTVMTSQITSNLTVCSTNLIK